MNIKFRKNDLVSFKQDFEHYYTTIPAGSLGRIYKAKKDGTVWVTLLDSNITCGGVKVYVDKLVKEKDTEKESVSVGEIFVSCGGYEQTNVQFYKVIRVTKSMMEVVAIDALRKYEGGMHGTAMPDMNNHEGTVQRVKIDYYKNHPCFKGIWGSASKWSGEPVGFSEWH